MQKNNNQVEQVFLTQPNPFADFIVTLLFVGVTGIIVEAILLVLSYFGITKGMLGDSFFLEIVGYISILLAVILPLAIILGAPMTLIKMFRIKLALTNVGMRGRDGSGNSFNLRFDQIERLVYKSDDNVLIIHSTPEAYRGVARSFGFSVSNAKEFCKLFTKLTGKICQGYVEEEEAPSADAE